MNERLLFVAAGMAQAPAIREARQLGHHVVAMDGDARAPGLRDAQQAIVDDILDPAAIVRAARRAQVQGIVSVCCDVAMEAVAAACVELGMPGVRPEVVQVSRSKLLQRHALQDAQLPVPRFEAVDSSARALAAWDRLQPDAVVVKPVDASGSRGVSYVSAREQVAPAFESAQRNSRSGHVMVESFMPGSEYSVEGWVVGTDVHVLATSVKVRTLPPYLLDREVHFPDDLDAGARQLLVEHAARAIEACGFRDCPVHLECIMTPQGPAVVELAARGAGFKVFTEVLPRVTGISTTAAAIAASLGRIPDLESRRPRSAASLVFIDPSPGTLTSVSGLADARAVPGISEIVIYPVVGQRMNPLRSGADRAGHILAYGSDADTCRASARSALDKIGLEVAR